MSGAPVSFDTSHPPHGHPSNTTASTQPADKPATSSHPPPTSRDPTTSDAASAAPSLSGPAAASARSAELSSLTHKLRAALRQYPDFPKPGILFEDFLPIFADAGLHDALITALELYVKGAYGGQVPDVVVGLEARGFLFGPSLALRLGCGFVPARKEGKLPGETVTAGYKKEYGEDFFQMQKGGVKEGMKVVVVDDLIATGMSLLLFLWASLRDL